MIIIRSDYSDAYDELDRLESMPTPRMVAGLEAVLEFGFEKHRAQVHVDTMKLKNSGKKKSKVNKNDWKGEFSFPAKNDEGVSYGIYERERGGTHDFFNGIALVSKMIGIAIVRGLRRK